MLSNRMLAATGPIRLTDLGETASGTGTISGSSTSAPTTFLVLTMYHAGSSTATITDVSWGGNTCDILVQASVNFISSVTYTACIAAIRGAQTGNIVITSSLAISASRGTLVGATNVQSLTPVDTDTATGTGTSRTLSALNSAGSGGARIAGVSKSAPSEGVGWSGLTEIGDINSGDYRHSAATAEGSGSGSITASWASSSAAALVGVSIQ